MAENGFNRKLTAILSADVAGYSRLMSGDEAQTVKTLTAYREVLFSLIKQHRGRVVDSPGDNMLAEFVSIVDAVQCGVTVQKELQARNAALPEERRMAFRIGINLGDVIVDGDRIYGDGVNIAARIEGLAAPGGLSLSQNAYDQVENKLKLGYEYQGEHEVKNISKPVSVYRVLIDPGMAGHGLPGKKPRHRKRWLGAVLGTIILLLVMGAAIFWNYYYLPTPVDIDPDGKMAFSLPEGPSIAVLPFDNMTGDPDQDYFCDGITENIIAALSHNSELFVIARNSTFAYKEKSIDVRNVGRELGARYVLEGSVQKTGNQIRITAQLIDATSGKHLWSERYDRELKDIFALQDDITIKIMTSLGVALGQGEQFRLQVAGVNNLEAFLKLLEARNYFYRMNKEGNVLARKKAEEVIAIDPDASTAYSLVGLTHVLDLYYNTSENPLISFGRATESARKALALNDQDTVSHLLLGHLFVMRKEHEKAIAEMKRAIALNPSNADAYNFLGYFLFLAGHPAEGIGFMEKSIRLNPFPPSFYLHHLGHAYRGAGLYDKAIASYNKSIEREPDNVFAHIGLAATFSLLGREREAHAAGLEVLRISPEFSLQEFAKASPLKNKDLLDRQIEALRQAGLK